VPESETYLCGEWGLGVIPSPLVPTLNRILPKLKNPEAGECLNLGSRFVDAPLESTNELGDGHPGSQHYENRMLCLTMKDHASRFATSVQIVQRVRTPRLVLRVLSLAHSVPALFCGESNT